MKPCFCHDNHCSSPDTGDQRQKKSTPLYTAAVFNVIYNVIVLLSSQSMHNCFTN